MKNIFSFSFLLWLILWGCSSNSISQSVEIENLDKEKITQGYSNPVFEPVLADPSVVFDEETDQFYAYGTEDDWADGTARKLVPVLESPYLVNWKYVGDAFDQKP